EAVARVVVLVGLAGDERVQPERVLAGVEPARGGELLLAGELDGEDPGGDLLPGELRLAERATHGLDRLLPHGRCPARSSRIDRAAVRYPSRVRSAVRSHANSEA